MNIEKEIQKIQERNKQVEINKAWEISLTRRFIIVVATYVLIALYLYLLGVEQYLLHAIIPVIAFSVSTFVMSSIQSFWEQHMYKK